MKVMEALGYRQKEEWKNSLGGNWVRTGSESLWDAVLLAFRDYREASNPKDMIHQKTGFPDTEKPSEEWLGQLYNTLHNASLHKDDEEECVQVFFKLIPLRLFSSEIMPYLQKYTSSHPDASLEDVKEEALDKCLLLADYRQTKKKVSKSSQEVKDLVQTFLKRILATSQPISYEKVAQAMTNMDHRLIILSPHEKVMFDTKDCTEGGEFREVILVMAHPDGSYDSIGRMSYTKDGHQKISRLFHYDDPVVEMLQSK